MRSLTPPPPTSSPVRLQSLLPCALLILLSANFAGCHSALDDAMDSYSDGRYPAAAAQFRVGEREARALSAREYANYALYRGLTHLALGDASAAARWVGYAKQCADRDPSLFSDQDRGALVAAWRSMGHMPGEAGLAVAGFAAAGGE